MGPSKQIPAADTSSTTLTRPDPSSEQTELNVEAYGWSALGEGNEGVPPSFHQKTRRRDAVVPLAASTKPLAPADKLKWPAAMPDQVAAIQRLLPATGPDPAELAARFGKRTQARMRTITGNFDTLTALGKLLSDCLEKTLRGQKDGRVDEGTPGRRLKHGKLR